MQAWLANAKEDLLVCQVLQHEEAVNLACEHIGVTRTRTDRYFDGTLGKQLVKMISMKSAAAARA